MFVLYWDRDNYIHTRESFVYIDIFAIYETDFKPFNAEQK